MTHEATGANLADGLDTQAASQAASPVVLDVRGLVAEVQTPRGSARLVDSVSLSVAAGKTLAVVGESGSGKTMTFLSALGIAPPAVRVTAGQVLLGGRDVLASTPEQLRAMRGTVVSMVFQDPLTALNPVFTVGAQISEVLRAHLPISAREARERAVAGGVQSRESGQGPQRQAIDQQREQEQLCRGALRSRLAASSFKETPERQAQAQQQQLHHAGSGGRCGVAQGQQRRHEQQAGVARVAYRLGC